jgi:hypothetical protein
MSLILAAVLVLLQSQDAASAGATLRSLIDHGLHELDPTGELTVVPHPSLSRAAVEALRSTDRRLGEFADWSSNGGVPPPGILLVERVLIEPGVSGVSVRLPGEPVAIRWPAIYGQFNAWVGGKNGILACGRQVQFRAEWNPQTNSWQHFLSGGRMC